MRKDNTQQIQKAIVAGNAPSLTAIDYARLPLSYEVFRANQFYLEDAYYLGKNIKAVTFAQQALFEHIYTMQVFNNTKEYKIDSIIINDSPFISNSKEEFHVKSNFLLKVLHKHSFIDTLYNGKLSENIGEFLEYNSLQKLYSNKNPTSGIYLCAIAVALGHKEIYLTGIDFYEGKTLYAFDHSKTNLLKVMPWEFESAMPQQKSQQESYHSKAADLEALEFLAKTYNVEFYSLSPASPLSRYIPLAPITNNTTKPEKKPPNHTDDIILPPEHAYRTFRILNEHIDYSKRGRVKNNFYLKLLYDLARLPRDIKYCFKKLKIC
ncbi:alpha-2,3-sialyltransferase [Helicobacter equorum]|uniref:alpha-2,3-sialyltransferase n=1 Tax=Helicobacter equorum TaxID=361872 RepID=UPI000CF17EE0|nr:alpha-2,3-sialyltransferase [Helicobacter equorum]